LNTQGIDINCKDINGNTPLLLAVLSDKYESVALLLYAKADPNIPNNNNILPIHEAVRLGNITTFNLLVEAQANLFILTENGYSLLHIAAQYGRIGILEYLISHFPEFLSDDLVLKDNNGFTALHYASLNGNDQCVKSLISQAMVKDIIGFSSLHWSILNSNVKCTSIYFEKLNGEEISNSLSNIDIFKSIGLTLDKCREDNRYADVTFYFESIKIKAHKIICSSHSFFRNLFNKTDDTSRIIMTERDFKYSIETFQAYLQYVYTGTFGKIESQDTIKELSSFAKELKLKNLLKAVESDKSVKKKKIIRRNKLS